MSGKAEANYTTTVEMLRGNASSIGDSIAIYFYDEEITYRQLNQSSNRIANTLKAMGVKKGDRVSILTGNAPDFYYSFFGAQKAGAAAGTVSMLWQAPEVAHLIEDSKPSVMFVNAFFNQIVKDALTMTEHRPRIIEDTGSMEAAPQLGEISLAKVLAEGDDSEPDWEGNENDFAGLFYSSGTTGRPKGAMISHRAMIAVARAIYDRMTFPENTRVLILLPLFHINPICCLSIPSLYYGASIVLRRNFSVTEFWPTILDYRVTHVMAVPTMYSFIHSSVDPKSLDLSGSVLKYCFCGTAPMPEELLVNFQKDFKVHIVEGYGLTEATGLVTLNPPGKNKVRSIGTAILGQDVRILDEDNNELPRGEYGEICVKGDVNMTGYYNNEPATRESLKGGYLHTSDMGYMDEDGYFFIVDRKTDMIIRGGENIYPREIEECLYTHPAVREASVIGIPHKHYGEVPKAYISLHTAGSVTGDEMKAFLKGKIADFKIPAEFQFLDDLPKSILGKIMKKKLREMESPG